MSNSFLVVSFCSPLTSNLSPFITRMRLDYARHVWNLVPLAVISLSIASVGVYIVKWRMARNLTTRFALTHGNSYMNFQRVASANELLMYMIGLLVFISNIKVSDWRACKIREVTYNRCWVSYFIVLYCILIHTSKQAYDTHTPVYTINIYMYIYIYIFTI